MTSILNIAIFNTIEEYGTDNGKCGNSFRPSLSTKNKVSETISCGHVGTRQEWKNCHFVSK